MSAHPAQSHILMAGGQDGVLAVWDLRSTQHPATLLSADKVMHLNITILNILNINLLKNILNIIMFQAAISEVVFHPNQPDHVLTCSQGGEVCHWNTAAQPHSIAQHYSNTR